MPDSGLHIIGEHFERVNHHLLALPGATLGDNPHGQKPRPCAVAMPQADPLAGARAGRRGRHRRRRGRNRRARRPDGRGDRLGTGRPDLRPRLAERKHRGRRAQYDPLSDHVARAPAAAARHADGDDLRVPGAQCAGGALQGDGRVRHQRRQHDQARKLHGRRRSSRQPSSTPMSRRIPRTARWRWPSKSSPSSRARSRSSASTRPTRCASPPRRAERIEEGLTR